MFSCAVFHWIDDHERLFARLHAALKPGGRLVAQCGGYGNIANVVAAMGERAAPWHFATPEDTERRLLAAGFARRPRVARAQADDGRRPRGVRRRGVPARPPARARARAQVVAALGDPPILDYVRLNIEATA